MDTTVVVHFDQRLRETTYDAFVAMIADRAPMAGFLMTPDAAFGYQRAGTPAALAALGSRLGFEVVVVPRPARRPTGAQLRGAGGHRGRGPRDRGAAARSGHCVVGEATATADGSPGRGSRLPVALPPDGELLASADGECRPGAGATDRAGQRPGLGAPGPRIRASGTAGRVVDPGALRSRVRHASRPCLSGVARSGM